MRFDPFAELARRRLRRRAERWFVRRLDPGMLKSDRVDFERWLAEDPEHARAWREVDCTWSFAREAARHPEIAAALDRTAARRAERHPWRFARNPLLATAASLLVLIGLAGPVVLGWHGGEGAGTVHATRTGEQRNVVLGDGSRLLLDTDSAVVVHRARRARVIDVTRGRVEFSVKHDPDLPFIVHAGGGTITDVGTVFQTGVSGGVVHVVLIKGKVTVAAGGSRASLDPGQALEFDRAGIVTPAHPADLAAALGWTHGQLIVQDWPLARVLTAMNRYSELKIAIADPTLRDIHATGSFRTGDQQKLVRILQAGWPIRAERISATKILLFRD